MLILIGVAPTAYALNRALPDRPRARLHRRLRKPPRRSSTPTARATTSSAIRARRSPTTSTPTRFPRAPTPRSRCWCSRSPTQVQQYGSLAKTPLDKVQNVRNDMYLASEAMRVLAKDKESELKPTEVKKLAAFKKQLDLSTKFIPIWVKIVRRDRARPRHDGRLEAHRHHRRREDRQDAPDLRPGRGRRDHRRRRRSARPTAWACRCRRRTCCPPASPARWSPTARACSGRPCAISRSAGC